MKYHFIGIGGIGMSAIARFLHQRGDVVSGYDRTESPLTQQLVREGMSIHYEDDPSLIPDGVDMVVYTPAVPCESAEMQYCVRKGIPMVKRSQVLGELTRGKKCVAVAGTHGKTSTSSMIAHILSRTELGCSAFLGGIAKNFESNVVVDNQSDYVVVEADEYDRSFLQLHPFCSVITSTDPDHLDVYGTQENMLEAFGQFAAQTAPDGVLIAKAGIPLCCGEGHCGCEEHGGGHKDYLGAVGCPIKSYSAQEIDADYYSQNVRNYKGNIYFDLRTPKGVFYDIALTNAALYSVENAVAAAAAVLELGVGEQDLREGLKSYQGVSRRFDYRINDGGLVMIDDYAHHPQEIAACLKSVRYLYPGKRMVVVFQPHLYSRTRDFADEFARVLSVADELIMMPIYPAREQRIPGVSSSMVLHKVSGLSKYLCSADQVLELVPALYPDVVVTMGAGDIDRLVPRLESVLREGQSPRNI